MFWRKRSGPATPLHFKDGKAAVDYASQFMDCEIAEGRMLPALVLDATKEFRAAKAVHVRPDGIQEVLLRVCGKPDGFLTLAHTIGPTGPHLEPGDLVAWEPVTYHPELARTEETGEPRMGWVGLIIGRLTPTLVPKTGWVGAERFTP